MNGSSQLYMNITTVWLRLLREEACLLPVDKKESPICLNTTKVLQKLCPCNGWDWTRKGLPIDRHVGMFCRPREQCPLLYDVLLHNTQYLTYNATPTEMCLFKANAD